MTASCRRCHGADVYCDRWYGTGLEPERPPLVGMRRDDPSIAAAYSERTTHGS